MEIIQFLQSYLVIVVSTIIFLARLLFSSIAEYIQEFKQGEHSYRLCQKKIEKKYGIRLLLFLSALLPSLFLLLSRIDFGFLPLLPIEVKMGIFLLIMYVFFILFSYAVLSCYDLLTHGVIQYRAIVMRTGEIAYKVLPLVLFSFFYKIVFHGTFLYEEKIVKISDSFFDLSLIDILIDDEMSIINNVVGFSLVTIALLFLLVDKKGIKEVSISSFRTTYAVWPTLIGLSFSGFSDYIPFFIGGVLFLLFAGQAFINIAIPFLGTCFYGLGYFLLLYIHLRIFNCMLIMLVSYWLYSRKKQTVPFGKEYIESLEG
jgi:hypothetical protein